jgi:formylglycine-generating enzyme required for sulfatase activity
VDTTGLAAWGKANGIDLVQLVVQAPDYGGMKTSRVAQLVDCKTGMLSGRGTYRTYFTPKGVDINAVIELVPVAGGVIEMGCKCDRDGTCISNETLHWVKVNDFHIGKYPITQAQWRAVMGWLPGSITSAYRGDSKPVIYVSYDEIVHSDTGFLAKLNKLTGKNYRLPTEAEWEYAARGCSAGTCESFEYSGDKTIDSVAWYYISSGNPNGPQPVGGKNPNALGIHDMSGNVFEWCYDWYGTYASSSASSPLDNPTGPTTPGSSRVLRGGSWGGNASYSRVAFRDYIAPSPRNSASGFRVVLP